MFEALLRDWRLTPDGAPIVTATGTLLPVIADGQPAMLKRFTDPEEAAGVALLRWWDGDGAARLLAQQSDDTVLMERATGTRSLASMASSGKDEAACRILCAAARALHRPRPAPPPPLTPLRSYFRSLLDTPRDNDSFLGRAAAEAERLFAEPQDICPLHGDLHHGNILDFGNRGFLAIDPKGLLGERTFDFTNIFCNPDIDMPDASVARDPSIFAARLATIAETAELDRERLLRCVIAWCGLSAVWFLGDGNPLAGIPLAVGSIALGLIEAQSRSVAR